MDHKRAMLANNPRGRAKISGDARRSHGTDIVKRQRRLNRAEKIIEGDTIGDGAPRCLERQMNMGNLVAASYRSGIRNASYSALINGPSEDAIDFIGRLGRLGHGTIGHVVSQMNRIASKNDAT